MTSSQGTWPDTTLLECTRGEPMRPPKRNFVRFARARSCCQDICGDRADTGRSTPRRRYLWRRTSSLYGDPFCEGIRHRVIAYDSIRHQGGEAAGQGPTGWIMPAYIASDRDVAARNGEDAVIEYLLLSRCHYLVHNGSSLARTVLLNAPILAAYQYASQEARGQGATPASEGRRITVAHEAVSRVGRVDRDSRRSGDDRARQGGKKTAKVISTSSTRIGLALRSLFTHSIGSPILTS